MREIQLNGGKVSLVDDEDYETYKDFVWCCNSVGYATTIDKITRIQHSLHRDILSPQKGLVTDHINGNRLDNRRCNLRAVTQQQNTWNRTVSLGVVPYIGVTMNGKRFGARITVSGRGIWLGTFDTPELAHAAYLNAKKLHHIFLEKQS